MKTTDSIQANVMILAFLQKVNTWSCRNGGWLDIVMSVALVLLTFPMFEPDFEVGLDSSYVWGFNWLFDHDYSTLTHLIYPYGPFLWLKSPVIEGVHFPMAVLGFSLLKFFFAWQSFKLARGSGCHFLIAVLVIAFACVFGNIDVFIVFDVAILVLMHMRGAPFICFLAAVLLAVFSLFVKVSIGVQSCSVLFFGWVIDFVRSRNIKRALLMASVVAVALLVVGFAVCRGISTTISAYWGMIHLVSGYSESLVVMPHHRAWSLVLFVVSCIILPFLLKDSDSRRFFIMLVVALFATWKHGITREDFMHFKQLISFASCLYVTVFILTTRRRLSVLGCCVLGFSMLLASLAPLRYDSNWPLTKVRPGNLLKVVTEYPVFVKNIESTLSQRKLPAALVNEIDTSSVDCYPWDHIFVAANGFRWQPRATFEVGAGNSLWLNHKAAQNYSGSTAVEFILFHKLDISKDRPLQSLDDRYILNDEPDVIDSIFANYCVADTGWYGILLQHGIGRYRVSDCGVVSTSTTQWGQWIPVPQCDSVCLRAEVYASDNLFGQIRSLLYKPDIYYIDYKMPDGSEQTFRYSPGTVKGGLWVGPMLVSCSDIVLFLKNDVRQEQPQAIRLRPRHRSGHKSDITVRFRKTIEKIT